MANSDYNIANQSFPSFRTDLNNALAAIASTNSGTSAPSTTFANQLWYDTSANILYIRNEDNDANIPLLQLDQSNDVAATLATIIDILDASGTNTAGTDLTIRAGAGTGSGAGGNIILQTANAGSSGSSVNSHATAVTIDDAGNVLVGGTTFDNGGLSSNANGINVFDATAPIVNVVETTGNTSFFLGKTASDCFIATADAQAIRFHTSDAERMRILSGGGLTFNGDTATANALNDYEEGTWTPAYSISGASFSYGIQVGRYVKVGDMVVASCRIRGQRSGGSGDLQLTGLPYATNSATNLNQAASIGFTNGWTNSPKGALTGINNTIIVFKKSGSSSALSNITDDITQADVSTSSTSSNDLILTVAYVAA